MPPRARRNPSAHEVRLAARATVAALEYYGLTCCLFGSAACSLWGMSHRTPNDVDMIVYTDIEREELKEMILAVDRRFYLVPSRKPGATYQVMHFALTGAGGRRCKVDILTPGVLDIPDMPSTRIHYSRRFPGLPILPFVVLILLKLKGWTDHRDSDEPHYRAKRPADEDDINELLELIPDTEEDEDGSLLDVEWPDWIPDRFVEDSAARISEYVEVFPETMSAWRQIGFQD
ncbi:hypothetical protein HGRIS_000085 [Hohenbuehelia grisea]|uniref:Uncharacterized protein n=1 Tax=Hohenbuehelia grisea TaxID=104357 RepID=A0ABR3JQ16_9AGAR